jgi:protein-tyrosine-phosphatase
VQGDASGPNVEIVFVCTGNRARSPLAEFLLRRRADGLPVRIVSRGTSELGPVSALTEMARAANDLGVDLSGHRATAIGPESLRDADLVIGFEPFHVAAAVVDGGAARERTFTLPELVELASVLDAEGAAGLEERVRGVVVGANGRRTGSVPSQASITDPLGGSAAVFRDTARHIEGLVARLGDVLFGPSDATRRL